MISFVQTQKATTENGNEHVHNLVMTAGKTDMITQYFKGSAYTAAWYLGLKASGHCGDG